MADEPACSKINKLINSLIKFILSFAIHLEIRYIHLSLYKHLFRNQPEQDWCNASVHVLKLRKDLCIGNDNIIRLRIIWLFKASNKTKTLTHSTVDLNLKSMRNSCAKLNVVRLFNNCWVIEIPLKQELPLRQLRISDYKSR